MSRRSRQARVRQNAEDRLAALRARQAALADPNAALDALSAIWSDDVDAYATGKTHASQVTCALCMCAPCRCPPFGSPAYFALLDARHRKNPAKKRGGPR